MKLIVTDLHHPEGWLPHAVFLGFLFYGILTLLSVDSCERVELVVLLLGSVGAGVRVRGAGGTRCRRCLDRHADHLRLLALALAARLEPRLEVRDVTHAELRPLVGSRFATSQRALVESPRVKELTHLLGDARVLHGLRLRCLRCLRCLRLLRFLRRLGNLGLGLAEEQVTQVDDGDLAALACLAAAAEALRDGDLLLDRKHLGLHACEPGLLAGLHLDTVREQLGREQPFATENLDRLVHGLGTGVNHHFDNLHEGRSGGSHIFERGDGARARGLRAVWQHWLHNL